MTPKRNAIGVFKFNLPLKRYQTFSEYFVDGYMIGDVGPTQHFGPLAAEPGEYKIPPPVTRATANSEKEFSVREKGADFDARSLCVPLARTLSILSRGRPIPTRFQLTRPHPTVVRSIPKGPCRRQRLQWCKYRKVVVVASILSGVGISASTTGLSAVGAVIRASLSMFARTVGKGLKRFRSM